MNNNRTTNPTLSKAALTAGYCLLLMTVLAILIFPSLKVSVSSIIGISVIILLDLIIAVSLYFLLKPVNKNLSAIMAALRIIYAAFFVAALSKISNLTTFYAVWDLGLIIFGIHLFFLGLLSFQSGYIPKWIGILLFIASAGYIIDPIIKLLGYTFSIGMFTFFGEPILALWLVIKGRKIAAKEPVS
jgi:hypothetical protein